MAPPSSARRLDAAAFASLLWTVAVALPAARALGPRRAADLDPVLIDYATVTASLGSLGLAIASAYRVLARRRLELGVADRAASALVLASTAVAVGVIGSLSSVSTPERILPLCLVAASCAVAASVAAPDPTTLARASRSAVALAILATPFGARRRRRHAGRALRARERWCSRPAARRPSPASPRPGSPAASARSDRAGSTPSKRPPPPR